MASSLFFTNLVMIIFKHTKLQSLPPSLTPTNKSSLPTNSRFHISTCSRNPHVVIKLEYSRDLTKVQSVETKPHKFWPHYIEQL